MNQVLPVRDAAEAGRYLRFVGLDPDLATISGDRWTAPLPDGSPASLQVLIGDDQPSRVLTAAEWSGLSIALVRSIPTRFDLLGTEYLAIIARVLVEATACRAERLRLGEPEEQLDADLVTLARAVEAALHAVDPREGDLVIDEAAWSLPSALRPHVPMPPVPVTALNDLIDVGFALVDDHIPDRPAWGMLRHDDGAALMVHVVDEKTVTKVTLVEGPDALEPWARYGCRLTKDASFALRLAFYPGLNRTACLQRAADAGFRLRGLSSMDAGNDRKSWFFVVDQLVPRRRQVLLALVIGSADEVLGRWLIEGPAAIDQMARLLRRIVDE